jgi:hypothetical protein
VQPCRELPQLPLRPCPKEDDRSHPTPWPWSMTGGVWLRTRTSSTTCFYMRKALPPRAVELTEGGRGEGGIVFVEDDRCAHHSHGTTCPLRTAVAHLGNIRPVSAFGKRSSSGCIGFPGRVIWCQPLRHRRRAVGSWEVTSYPVLNSKYMIQPRWTKCSVTYIRRHVMFRREGYPGHGIDVDS